MRNRLNLRPNAVSEYAGFRSVRQYKGWNLNLISILPLSRRDLGIYFFLEIKPSGTSRFFCKSKLHFNCNNWVMGMIFCSKVMFATLCTYMSEITPSRTACTPPKRPQKTIHYVRRNTFDLVPERVCKLVRGLKRRMSWSKNTPLTAQTGNMSSIQRAQMGQCDARSKSTYRP